MTERKARLMFAIGVIVGAWLVAASMMVAHFVLRHL